MLRQERVIFTCENEYREFKVVTSPMTTGFHADHRFAFLEAVCHVQSVGKNTPVYGLHSASGVMRDKHRYPRPLVKFLESML